MNNNFKKMHALQYRVLARTIALRQNKLNARPKKVSSMQKRKKNWVIINVQSVSTFFAYMT